MKGQFIIIILLAGLFTFLCFQVSFSKQISKFDSVASLMNYFGDYTKNGNTFEVLKKTPLHIRLSPGTVPRDLPENINSDVNRSIVYGIYRSFVHTPVKEIKVTAIPIEQERKGGQLKERFLPGYKRTVHATRDEALSLAKKFLNIDSFSDLITSREVSGHTFHNRWIKAFDCLYYNDECPPGLNKFVGLLAK